MNGRLQQRLQIPSFPLDARNAARERNVVQGVEDRAMISVCQRWPLILSITKDYQIMRRILWLLYLRHMLPLLTFV